MLTVLLDVLILLFVVGAWLALTPRSSFVTGDTLTVQTYALAFRFDLRSATTVMPVSHADVSSFGTLRLFGIGWPLRPVGWFRNATLGTFLNLANDPSNMVLVRFPRRAIIVSPDQAIALRIP